MKWERTFEVSAPPMQAWEAFSAGESDVPKVFRRGDAYLSRGGVTIDVTIEQPGKAIEWSETEGDERWDMSVTFTETDTGTSITIVRSGFGTSDEWMQAGTARWIGWQCVMADLEVYFRTGTKLNRFYTTPFLAVGVYGFDDGAGVHVRATVPGSFAEQAGLVAGDTLVRLGGAPVWGLAELWSLPRVLNGKVEAQYVRGTEVLTGVGVLET